jgi:hypothetical protein
MHLISLGMIHSLLDAPFLLCMMRTLTVTRARPITCATKNAVKDWLLSNKRDFAKLRGGTRGFTMHGEGTALLTNFFTACCSTHVSR